MSLWEQILLREIDMDCADDSFIAQRCRSGLDMSNQLWSVFITGLGEIDLVARPEGCSFLAITCIEVIGRGDELSGRESWFRSPLTSLLPCFKLLLPNRAQCGDGGQRFHPVWGLSSLQRIEQQPAVGSDLIGVLPTLLLLFGQAFLFEPFSISLDPFSWHMSRNPMGSHFREDVQDIDHRLSHTQGTIQGTDPGQDMGRVGTLTPSSLQLYRLI